MSVFTKETRSGFTLIELLVVISIIGLLASVVLTSLNSARTSAQDAKRVSDLNQLQKSIELYYHNTGSYPASDGWVHNSSGQTLYDALVSNYIAQIPIDPTPDTSGGGGGSNFY